MAVTPYSVEGRVTGILTPTPPRPRADGFCHIRGQLLRACDGFARASRNNRSCNLLSKPFFAIIRDHSLQFGFACRSDPLRRAVPARWVHAHVERAVGADRKSAFRLVDLR